MKNEITILVSLKHMGNVAKKVKEYPITLENRPTTFGELIEETVKACISAYTARAEAAVSPAPLTEEQYEGMREIGKFAFGFHYNENGVSEEKAVSTAIEAVTDGLVRVFKGTEELCDLNEKISINENDVFTFVRLTMLSGRIF